MTKILKLRSEHISQLRWYWPKPEASENTYPKLYLSPNGIRSLVSSTTETLSLGLIRWLDITLKRLRAGKPNFSAPRTRMFHRYFICFNSLNALSLGLRGFFSGKWGVLNECAGNSFTPSKQVGLIQTSTNPVGECGKESKHLEETEV